MTRYNSQVPVALPLTRAAPRVSPHRRHPPAAPAVVALALLALALRGTRPRFTRTWSEFPEPTATNNG